LARETAGAFVAAIRDFAIPAHPRESGNERTPSSPIGLHRLRDGSLACGVGLAFGHADTVALEELVEAAAVAGANGLRAAPGRALLAIGLEPPAISTFINAAGRLGFIVRDDDPRRRVVACAGAPICASAHIASRALAPVIAEQAAPVFDGAGTIHISGCSKGCAHSAAAALTVVGTPDGCALMANGTTTDAPFAIVPASELLVAMAGHARGQKRRSDHV
jgi:precorrin-3B synthase